MDRAKRPRSSNVPPAKEPATLDKRVLDRLRNHPVIAVAVIVSVVVIGIANFSDASTKLIALVTGKATPEIRSILVDEGEDGYKIAIKVLNPTTSPVLLTNIRLFERLYVADEPGSVRVCAADSTLYVGPQVKLQAETRGRIGVLRVSDSKDLGYGRDAYGLLAVECGGDNQQFGLWSDIAAEAKSGSYTTLYVHVPKSFTVDTTEYLRRRGKARVAEVDSRFPLMRNATNELVLSPDANYTQLPKTFTLDSRHFRKLDSVPAESTHILQIDIETDQGQRLSYAWDFQGGAPTAVRDTPPEYGH